MGRPSATVRMEGGTGNHGNHGDRGGAGDAEANQYLYHLDILFNKRDFKNEWAAALSCYHSVFLAKQKSKQASYVNTLPMRLKRFNLPPTPPSIMGSRGRIVVSCDKIVDDDDDAGKVVVDQGEILNLWHRLLYNL